MSTPALAEPPAAPALPADTAAQRRALQEKGFAALAAAAYAVELPAGNPYAWFIDPPRNGKPPMLVAFGHVVNGVGVLSFRGTVTLRNWLSDAHVSTTGTPPRHRGFENCWQRLRPQVLAWLEQARPEELNLVGHSLGGAIAQIAAFELAPRWRIGAVVGFGAPLVGRTAFAAAYDAMPIFSRPGVTLAAVTTTFVFKTDLVRSIGLPRLGFVRNGRQIVIDEDGRESDAFVPWNLQAFDVAYRAIVGPEQTPAVAALPLPAFMVAKPDAFGIGVATRAPPPPLTMRAAVDWLRPYAEPVVKMFPQAQAALLGIGALIGLFFAVVFLKRDASYHSVSNRYVGALAARVARWQPLAYAEHGDALLAAGRAEEALPYLAAALQSAEAEARAAGVWGENALIQWTWQVRVSRSAALGALARFAEEATELGTLLESYGQGPLRVATSAEGRVTAGPQFIALQRWAVAVENGGRPNEAIAGYRRLLEAAPSFDFATFQVLMDRARQSVGATNTFAIAFQWRKAAVDAEHDRLEALRKEGFERAMAATWAWAHGRIAACAYALNDAETVIAAANAGLALDDRNAALFQLRGAAHARLKQRDEAVADMSAAIALEPGNPHYHYARGNVRLMVGARIVPAEGDSAMGAIEAELRVGEKELIEADLRKTLELDPTHAMARTLLQGIEAAEAARAAEKTP